MAGKQIPVGRPEGGSTAENVKLLHRRPKQISPDFKMPVFRIHEVDTKRKYYCTCCGKSYVNQQGNFLTCNSSPLWKGNNGYVPICRSCTDALFNSYTQFYSGNEEHALERLCQIFDWYYNESASAMTASQAQVGKGRVSLYPSKMCTRQVAINGTTYLDTDKDYAFGSSVVDPNTVSSGNGDDDEETFTVTKQMQIDWGMGYKAADYEYLEGQYKDWLAKVDISTKSQEILIRNICFAQLNVRRAQAGGYGKVTDAMKALTDLLTTCNLTPKQANDIANTNATQQSLGQLIKRIEDEEPITEQGEEFKDPDGIRKYIGAFFFGHLAKVLRIKNDYTKQYEEEMKKYTVELPKHDESIDRITELLEADRTGETDE